MTEKTEADDELYDASAQHHVKAGGIQPADDECQQKFQNLFLRQR